MDVFVAKYDANGLLQWAKSAGGSTGNWGAGIDIDTAGNSYVVGRYSTTSTFGPGEPNQTVLVGPLGGSDEIFVAKFGPNGNLAWVRGGQGQAEHDQGTAIAVDAAGNSYATGTYRGHRPLRRPAQPDADRLRRHGGHLYCQTRHRRKSTMGKDGCRLG
ncbi:MAG: hypothetical protein V9H26_12715 [Verrucomicrobiota bacterium]